MSLPMSFSDNYYYFPQIIVYNFLIYRTRKFQRLRRWLLFPFAITQHWDLPWRQNPLSPWPNSPLRPISMSIGQLFIVGRLLSLPLLAVAILFLLLIPAVRFWSLNFQSCWVGRGIQLRNWKFRMWVSCICVVIEDCNALSLMELHWRL